MTKAVRIAVVYPDLLGTYGDGGNGLVLARRAAWRGLEAELIQAGSEGVLPNADIYCLGGGEDGPQVRAAQALVSEGTLVRRVSEGAVVLAVCAGYQIVGASFPGADASPHEGVGLLDVVTTKGTGPRSVGEVAGVISDEATNGWPSGLVVPALSGFENHGGVTALGPDVVPLARVSRGVGNGDGSGTEGAVAGRVVGTYLHGPVLARNPVLADVVLAWALGAGGTESLGWSGADEVLRADEAAAGLRDERLGGDEAAGGSNRRMRRGGRRRARAG